MGKLLKYEIRKNRASALVILVGLALLEVFFLVSLFTAKESNSAILGVFMSALLLVFYSMVCFFMVFILSVRNYSGEINTKTGFMLFMTPRTPLAIIGAKLLYTLIFGGVLALLLIGCAVGDWTAMAAKFGSIESTLDMVKDVFEMFRIDPARYLIQIVGYVLNFLISFFSVVMLAYFAVTLSATFLQSAKYRGIISFLIFLGLLIVIRLIEGVIPGITPRVNEVGELLVALLPSAAFNLAVMAACVFGTVWLLEYKVSL